MDAKSKKSKLPKGILAIVIALTMVSQILPMFISPMQAKMDAPTAPLVIYLSSITDATLVPRVYDGTRNATVKSYGTIPSNMLINGASDVYLTGGVAMLATYSSANAGTTTGMIGGVSLAGADASKYGLEVGILYATGLITPAEGVFPSDAPTINVTYEPGLLLSDISLPEGYAWADPTAAVLVSDQQQIAVTYTDPSGNYTPANGFITLNITQAMTWPSPTTSSSPSPTMLPSLPPSPVPTATASPSATASASPSPMMLPSLPPSPVPTATAKPAPELPSPTTQATPISSQTATPSPTATIPALITDDHFAYMKGYPDGTFDPAGNMTRAEVAVMFDRLMVKGPDYITTYQGTFRDVPGGVWYTEAIENLSRLGILEGRDNNWFDPDSSITRAEFVTIATRFQALAATVNKQQFIDVTRDEWFYNAVNSAAANAWITGYADGTFRPNDNITRAEAVTITNRVSGRRFDSSFDKQLLVQFFDVPTGYWGYGDIMEATNSHNYVINSDGSETWTGLQDN